MKKIDPKTNYSLEEASDFLGMSQYYIKLFIEQKKLKANVMGQGTGKRYFIKGEWLISFDINWSNGRFQTIHH